ncbi:hypothetical protein VMT65_02250 [Nocardia sp. CDC153]|nr:hypothetical protein [Nocardia sp. CDC153]MEC3951846.1 hypothetical protein [Nocardia sp. CDC153]
MTRRSTANVYLSLDGVVEAPENWHFPYHDEPTETAPTTHRRNHFR